MRPTLPWCALVALFALAAVAPAQERLADGPRLSPFRAMRLVDDGIEVQVDDDVWYELQAISGIATATLLVESKRRCGERWWKRITEDLPALLGAIGGPDMPVGREVDLVVRDLGSGEVRRLEAVPMTEAKRRLVKAANDGRVPVDAAGGARATGPIAVAAAHADLDAFGRLLDERFAYRRLRDVDLVAMLRAAKRELGRDPVPVEALAREIDRILRAFGDGHSRLATSLPELHPGYLPFLVQQLEGGPVAFRADRGGLVAADHPFVVAIDGVPFARWAEVAAARATSGSPTMRMVGQERGLRWLGELRAELGLRQQAQVTVTLRGAAGSRDVILDVAEHRPTYGAWPRGATRRLDGDLGYLRLPEMTGDAARLDDLEQAMRSFRDTRGLVIDVRGNGGGTRDALLRLLPYLLAPDAQPVVTNVAAARLAPGRGAAVDALADRGLHPADWQGFDAEQRSAIAAFLKTFTPSWRLPPGEFSPLCFLVQRHRDNPAAFHYDRPVAVLIDRGCFSATDVFAAAFGALPQVTLVGEPTRGGSGRARPYVLPASGIRLQLSSMVSYRPDGVLFEGRGVEPDILVSTTPEDLVGDTDTALQRAVELL